MSSGPDRDQREQMSGLCQTVQQLLSPYQHIKEVKTKLADDTGTIDCFKFSIVISDVPSARLKLTRKAWVHIFIHGQPVIIQLQNSSAAKFISNSMCQTLRECRSTKCRLHQDNYTQSAFV